jgi:hypothetical protein
VSKVELSYIETVNTVSIILNGRWRSLSLNTDQGRKALAACKEVPQDLDKIAEIADIATYIARHSFGRVIVDDKDRLRLDGKVVDYGLSEIILRLLTEGAEVGHLTKFLENVAQNPDPEVPPHLYSFLQKGGMPITPDGCFHAFKKVDTDYRSFHSGQEDVTVIDALGVPTKVRGRIPHPVGGVVLMNREDCNPNRTQTCSVGLHACSPYYLESWYGGSGRLLIVKIDPKDVTAIPNDYNDAKLRSCRLEIVAEIPEEDARTHFAKALESRYTPPAPLPVGTVTLNGEPIGEITEITIDDPLTEGRIQVSGEITVYFADPEVLKAMEQRGELAEGPEADFTPCDDCTCGAGGEMSLEDVIRAGIEKGEEAALEDSEFVCDFDEDDYGDVPDHMKRAFEIAFTAGYVETFELEHYYSESAFQQGLVDGRAHAKEDLPRDEFCPFFSEGDSYPEVSENHHDTYAKGYTVGYLSVFTLDGDEEVTDIINAELDQGYGDDVVGD